MGLLLMALTVVVYVPSMYGGFIWDDDAHLTENPCVVGPQGLKEIWTTAAARICPLTLSCFWLQHAIWGLNPFPYHLVNIVMHACSAILLWRILLRLDVPGAWFAALLWAVHPVQVESVAWITELKNTQSCLFYMLTILFFLKWMNAVAKGSPKREWMYTISIVFAVLAMFSKSSTVILPVVLGLCAYWVNGGWRWSYTWRLVPFFALAALTSALSMWTQQLEGAGDPQWTRTIAERLITAGNVVWFYLGTLLWPQPLTFIYPKWEVKAAIASSYIGFVAACSLLLFLCWKRHGRLRPLFFAYSYFVVALLPVMGLVNHFFLRYSFVGDHFQYIASAGFIAMVTGVVARMSQLGGQSGRRAGICIGCSVSVLLGVLTWRYEGVFADHDQARLWRDTLSKNNTAWLAHNNLGVLLVAQGNHAEGKKHYEECLRFNPNFAQAHNNLAVTLSAQENHAEAIVHSAEALRLEPNYAEAHYNFGNALLHQQQLAEAIGHYMEALRLNPNYSEAHNNLGNAFAMLGNYTESIVHFKEAFRLNPNNVNAQNNTRIIQEAIQARDISKSP